MLSQFKRILQENPIFGLLFGWLVVSFLITFRMPLHYDEAYYWVLSNNLALGYYDHPPLNMYLIRLSHTLLGTHEYSVRLVSILFQLASIYLIYSYLSTLTSDKRASFWWAVIYAVMPLAFFWGGASMNGDAGVITFSILSTILFKKAISEDTLIRWICFGCCVGLGILTKFTFLVLLPGLFLYLVVNRDRRRLFWRKEIYISILAALVLLTPFLIWNINHDFATFQFNLTVRHEPYAFRWSRLAVTGQLFLLLFSPVALLLSLLYLARVLKTRYIGKADLDPVVFIQLTLVPLFLYIGAGSVMKWHYMIVLCFPITVNSLLFFYHQCDHCGEPASGRQKKIGMAAAGSILVPAVMIIITVAAVIKVFQEPELIFGKKDAVTENSDPTYNRDAMTLFGTGQVGNHLDEVRQTLTDNGFGDLFIVANDYREASQLSFYTPSHPQIFLLGYKDIYGRNYIFFRQEHDPRLLGKNALYVTQYPSTLPKIRTFFAEVTRLEPFYVKDPSGNIMRIFYFYLCRNYAGDNTGIMDADRRYTL